MVVRVVDQCIKAQVHRVVVATDAMEVIDAVGQLGYEAIMTDADHASGTDRLAEAASRLGIPDEDVVVNVQGDEPLIEPALINAIVEKLTAAPEADMGHRSTPAHRFAKRFKSPCGESGAQSS